MDHSVGELTIDELTRRCLQEASHYLAGQDFDQTCCLELFRRAIYLDDQSAWQVLYRQYRTLLISWVCHHSKFCQINEEPTYLVDAALVNFWRKTSGHKLTLKFNNLGQLLQYLKRCIHSVIEDEYRRQQRWLRINSAWDEVAETVVDPNVYLEEGVVAQAEADILEQAILSRLPTQVEVIVATLSWWHNLSPHDIFLCYPDLFTDVRQIYRLKRTILQRLKRDPYLQGLWHKK